jgi:hypothetical protein
MSGKPSDSPNYPYEPEPYPILKALPEFWWLPEEEKTRILDARARMYGGVGYLPHKETDLERGR